MLKGKKTVLVSVVAVLFMSMAVAGCGRKQENYVAKPDSLSVQQEVEFDTLIADAYMNVMVTKLDESYSYRNDYELVSVTQDGDTVILYYDWYRASDQYSENCLEIQLIYHGVNGMWGEPQRTTGESKTIWTLKGEWECKDGETDIYFKINRCEEDKIYVEYEFNNFPIYDMHSGETTIKDLSSNGEVEMLCDIAGSDYSWSRVGVEREFVLALDVFREFKISSYPYKYLLTKVE